jgi:hypothetical protein
MSLHLKPAGDIPAEAARVARAAFPKGTVAIRLRDKLSALYTDEDFRRFYPPGGSRPWRHGDWRWLRCCSSLSTSATAKPPMPCALGSTGSMPLALQLHSTANFLSG